MDRCFSTPYGLVEYEDEISSLDKLEWGFAERSFFIRAVYRSKYLIILNTHKQRTDKRCLTDVATEFAALNENRKSNFGTFKESDLQISG